MSQDVRERTVESNQNWSEDNNLEGRENMANIDEGRGDYRENRQRQQRPERGRDFGGYQNRENSRTSYRDRDEDRFAPPPDTHRGEYRERDGRDRERYGGGRYGGGRYGGGRRDGQRHGGRRDNRDRDMHRNIERTTERERGRITNIVDNYGFMQCELREEQLFFHYSGFQVDVDPDSIKNGDELEFYVETNLDNDKKTAFDISLLPAGTIVLEELLEGTNKGVVETALQVPSRARNRRNPEPVGGKIREVVSDEQGNGHSSDENKQNQGELFDFSGRDLVDPRRRLKVGDVCEFYIYVIKCNGKRSATRVTLLHPGSKNREQGIIKECLETYGFIKCADRDEEMFFHYRELVDLSYRPREKDGLEFEVVTDEKGQRCATRITVVPRSTPVKFNKLLPEVYSGIIKKPLRIRPRRETRDGNLRKRRLPQRRVGGLLSHIIKNDDDEEEEDVIAYSDMGLMYRQTNLIPGDVVEFQIQIHKPTRQRWAANINLKEKTQKGRERGILSHFDPYKNFGFIKCENRDENMHFHQNEAPNGIKKGDDVEFSVLEPENGQPTGIRITQLEKGTVKFEEIEDEVIEGIVSQKLISPNVGPPDRRNRRHHAKDRSLIQCGKIKYEESKQDSQTQKQDQDQQDPEYDKPNFDTIRFNSHDLSDSRHPIEVGDLVQFQIKTVVRTNERCATRVTLVRPKDAEGRVHGLVETSFVDYGFLRCPKYPGGLFFHYSHIVGSRITVEVGMEFAFEVCESDGGGKRSAVRLVKLKKGTVELDDIDMTEQIGKVIQDGTEPPPYTGRGSRRYKHRERQRKIEYLDELKNCIEIDFTPQDLLNRATVKNDIVTFNIATDKHTKLVRATKIQTTSKAGYVQQLNSKKQRGTIRCATTDELFSFKYDDVKPKDITPAQSELNGNFSGDENDQNPAKVQTQPQSQAQSHAQDSETTEQAQLQLQQDADAAEGSAQIEGEEKKPKPLPLQPNKIGLREKDPVVFDVYDRALPSQRYGNQKRSRGAVNIRPTEFHIDIKGPLKGRILSLSSRTKNSENSPRVAKGPDGTRGFKRPSASKKEESSSPGS